MKYSMWFNKFKLKFNYGTSDQYWTMRDLYGDSNIVLEQEFDNVSEDTIKKVTKAINRQNKVFHVMF